MNEKQSEIEILEFFNYLYKKKFIFLLIMSIFVIAGVVKSFLIPYQWKASANLGLPTNRAMSALNLLRNASTKMQPVSAIEVFMAYNDIALSRLHQQQFFAAHKDQHFLTEITQRPGNRLFITVLAGNPETAKTLLQEFLLETKKTALEKINRSSAKTLLIYRKRIKMEVKRLESLAARHREKSQLSAQTAMSDSANASILHASLKNEKMARQYQNMLEKYRGELAGLHFTPLALDEIALYQVDNAIEIEKYMVRPTRVKTILAFALLGFLIGMMCLLLAFLYQNNQKTRAER